MVGGFAALGRDHRRYQRPLNAPLPLHAMLQ